MSTRYLLVGDCHIREGEHLSDIQNCLRFAVDVARMRSVDVVIFGGDLFHQKSSPAERLVLRDTLLALPCPAVLVRGNHEPLGDLAVFAGYPGVTVCERPELLEIGDTDMFALPWPEKAHLVAAAGMTGEAADQAGGQALGAMIRAMVATRRDPVRPLVIVGHLAVGGAVMSSGQPTIGRCLEATLGDLTDAGAAFAALSHVHRPQALAPGVVYVGSLTCCDHGEEGEQKRIGVLDVVSADYAEVEWLPTPCRRWLTIEAMVVDGGGVVEHVEGESESAGWCGEIERVIPWAIAGANVRYRFRCDESDQHLFDEPAIRRRFAAAHTLKVESEITRATASRAGAAEVAAARSVDDKLRAYGEAAGVEITPALLNKLATLEGEAANG